MTVALLIVQGAVSLGWAFTAFRVLFHLWRRSAQRAGTFVAGPVTFVRSVGDWLRDPAERRWRWALFGLTVAVMGLSIGTYAAG
jgi:hypothetical protein